MEAEPAPAQTRLRRLAPAARGLYLVGLAAAVVWLAVARGDDIAELLQDARPLLILAALAATFVLIVLMARFWTLSLRMLGHDASLPETALSTARALPARYIPGGVTFPAARIALLRAGGTHLTPLTVTAVLEMVVRPAVALTLGTILLATSGSLPTGLTWSAIAVAVAAIGCSPLAGGRVLARLAARRGVTLTMTWGGYAQLAVAEAAYWVWSAATFVLYLRAFPAADSFGSLHLAGAFMVAWTLGFLAVFAPQGVGVAEISLVGLVAAGAAGGDSAGIALAFLFAGYRLLLVARDVVAAGASEVIARRRARRGSGPSG